MEILLRPITLEDTDNIVKWRNLPSVKSNLYSQEELKPEQHMQYFRDYVCTGKCAQYIITVDDGKSKTDIGTTFIKNIDYQNNKGEFGIFIGEECARGKGYSKIAILEILKIAFEELNLNRVYLSVMADNEYAIKSYKSVGFVIEGVMREDYLRSDGYIDVIMMAYTKKNWLSYSEK